MLEVTGVYLHILGNEKFPHFTDFPFQLIQIGSRNGDQKIHVVEIFVVGKTFLQVISCFDGTVDVIKVGIGIASILYFGAIDAQLLSNSLDDPFFGLPG